MKYLLFFVLLLVGCQSSVRITDYGTVPTDKKELADFIKKEKIRINTLETELQSKKNSKEDLFKILEDERDITNRRNISRKIDDKNFFIESIEEEISFRNQRLSSLEEKAEIDENEL